MYREMFYMRVYGPPQALDRVNELLLHRNPLDPYNPFRAGLAPYSILEMEDFKGLPTSRYDSETGPLQVIPGLGDGRKYTFDGAVDGVFPIRIGKWSLAEYGPSQCSDTDYTIERLSFDLGISIVINGCTIHGLSGDYERIDSGNTRGMYRISSGEAVDFDERDDAFSGIVNLEGLELERRMGTSSTGHLAIGGIMEGSGTTMIDLGAGERYFGTDFDIWSCVQNELPETIIHHAMRFIDWEFIRGRSRETAYKNSDRHVMRKIFQIRDQISVIGESGVIFSRASLGAEFAIYQCESHPEMLFIVMKRAGEPLSARTTDGWDVDFVVYDTDRYLTSPPTRISRERPLPMIGTTEDIDNIVLTWKRNAAKASASIAEKEGKKPSGGEI